MKIEYELEIDDVVQFHVDHFKRDPDWLKRSNRKRIFLALFYAVLGVACYVINSTFWPFAYFLLFVAILWYLFYDKASEARIRRIVRKTLKKHANQFPKRMMISIKGADIEVTSDDRRVSFTDDDIIERIDHGDYHYWYFNEDDAIIIPVHKLDDPDALSIDP